MIDFGYCVNTDTISGESGFWLGELGMGEPEKIWNQTVYFELRS